MAKSSTSFTKGNKSGKGRTPTPEDIRKAAKVSQTMFQGVFHKFSLMPLEEFIEFMKAGKMNVMEKIIGTVMTRAMRGEGKAAALIWDRMMGRVKENIEVQLPKPMVIERPNGEQMVLGHEEVIDV